MRALVAVQAFIRALAERLGSAQATSARPRAIAAGLAVGALLATSATPALAGVGQTIVDKCGHEESFSGYTQAQYEEALKDMSTGTREYTSCEQEIRKAELAAAGGGTGAGPALSAHTAIPLTPVERRALRSANKQGATPVPIGGAPVRPGVVHADIASAINKLPHSLFALLALLLAAAVALAAGEVRKRVRARRDG